MMEATAGQSGIQPHGLLAVLDGGDLAILSISANAGRLIGRDASGLAGTGFLDLVGPASRTSVESLVREAWSGDAASFLVPILPLSANAPPLVFEALVHHLPGGACLVELERDPAPLRGVSPSPGSDSILRLVRRSLAAAAGLVDPDQVAAALAGEIRRFTGFDRVMVQRLADDFSGEVVAEETAEGIEPFLGLHAPAAALPQGARERYRGNYVRYIHDAAARPVAMVALPCRRSEAPPGLSRAVLRSPSPARVRQLASLEVATSLTVPLVVNDCLWGLVVCHHRRPRYLTHGQRSAVALCATVMSAQIGEKLRARDDRLAALARERTLRLLAGMKDSRDFADAIRSSLADLVSLFEADGAALLGDGEVHGRGSLPGESALSSLHSELQARPSDRPVISDRAGAEFPCLAGCLPQAAGVVAIPLGEDAWLAAFRNEVAKRTPLGASGDDFPRGASGPWPAFMQAIATELRAGVLDLVRHQAAGLERSNQELRRFAGVVAHEVKNQLQPGVLALSILRSGLAGRLGPEHAAIAEMGERSLTRLVRFTGELLDFAEAEMSALLEEIDLREVAGQAVRQLHSGEGGDEVEIEISALPRIMGLRVQMHHVLSNLLRNAVLHGRRGSRPLHVRIGFTVDSRNGPVVFVSDDGRGIAAEDQQRMFDYFARGKDSRSPGSGIGLAYCAQVIERQGNRLWVESSPGQGAMFCFTVTLVEEADA